MSLDVYLELDNGISRKGSGIFIRDDGATREISREEFERRFPGREPIVIEEESHDVYSANITHNLNDMARAAGLYYPLWRPEEIGCTQAEQLLPFLRAGLMVMKANPEFFSLYNPKNGWGNYSGLVDFVRNYLAACEEYPKATIRVSR